MHFPTRGVVFLLAVFWTFVLGGSLPLFPLTISYSADTGPLPSTRSLVFRRDALLPFTLERRLPTPRHPNGNASPRRLPLHPRLWSQSQPGLLRHRLFPRETTGVSSMVLPLVLDLEPFAYVPLCHGREGDKAQQGRSEPRGEDADWV